MKARSLKPLFSPRRIAVSGFTNTPDCSGTLVLKNILTSDFPGVVYPVHPDKPSIQGIPAFNNLAQTGGEIDLMIFEAAQTRYVESLKLPQRQV